MKRDSKFDLTLEKEEEEGGKRRKKTGKDVPGNAAVFAADFDGAIYIFGVILYSPLSH